MHALDPNLAPLITDQLQDQIDLISYSQRLAVTLVALFGGMALFLATIGLYAVMSYSVSQGTRELGLRMGRLKPGLTAVAAKPELAGLAANLEKAYPVEQKDQTFIAERVSRLTVSNTPGSGNKIIVIAPLLLGTSIVVLLVACLNLANMLLARGTARRKEIAIRLALGGNRWRVVRQLLTEGFVLALLGGVGGLVLGLWSSDLLVGSMRKLMPLDIVWSSAPNPAILAATFGFCLLGTLMFALGPALKISHSALVADLKEHAGEDVVRRRWKFLPRHPLVVVQIAFSLALITAAALFIRGAHKAAAVDTGLRPGASYILEVDAGLAGYEPKRAQELYHGQRHHSRARGRANRAYCSAIDRCDAGNQIDPEPDETGLRI